MYWTKHLFAIIIAIFSVNIKFSKYTNLRNIFKSVNNITPLSLKKYLKNILSKHLALQFTETVPS